MTNITYNSSGDLVFRRKNAPSAVYVTMAAVAVVTLQWFLWGFSLTFSDEGKNFIGNLKYVALHKVPMQPPAETNCLPIIFDCLYEVIFAAVTAIAAGAIAERGRPGPLLIFILFIWTTLVYDPIARWTWNRIGWSHRLGVLDFAGVIAVPAVHISSDAAAMAISVYLGKKANNVRNVVLHVFGTVVMWFGWFGFFFYLTLPRFPGKLGATRNRRPYVSKNRAQRRAQ